MFVPSLVKIPKRVSELLRIYDFHTKIFGGTLFRNKNVDGAMVLVLCTLSAHALYWYKVS